MKLEPELKFRLSRRKLTSLANARIAGTKTGPRADRDLVSTYYDTKKRKLRHHGLTLRVRRTGDEYVQTVKTAAVGGFAPERVGGEDRSRRARLPKNEEDAGLFDHDQEIAKQTEACFHDIRPSRHPTHPCRIERGGIGR